MGSILILAVLSFLLTWWQLGFSLVSVVAVLTTGLFLGRKVGYFCKLKTLVTCEATAAAVTALFLLLFHNLTIEWILQIIVCRGLFLAAAAYDIKKYVYIKEEVRRETGNENDR